MDKKIFTLSNGNEIAYFERPGGTNSLVLLHGITDSALSYEPLLDQISTDCHVYALDLRGHGDSSKPNGRYTTEAYADDVRHFVREVAGSPVMLAGHSLGGLVTVQVAVTAPELVSRIFLEDPPLYFVDDIDPIYQTLFEGMVVIATTLQDLSRSVDDWYAVMSTALDPYTGKPGLETMGEAKIYERLGVIEKMKPQALEDALDGSLKWDTDAVLAQIQCPVRMVVGDASLGAVITPDETAQMQAIVDGTTVIPVEGVGHLIHDGDPRVWLNAVNGWIRGS